MALTFTVSDLQRNVAGNQRVHTGTITITGTATADGDAITPAALGLWAIDDLELQAPVNSTSAPATFFGAMYNKSSGKIIFYSTGAAAQAAFPENTTAIANYVMRFVARGR